MKNFKINATSSNFPGYSYEDAVNFASPGFVEGVLGTISSEHMQLCPQNKGQLTEEFSLKLKNKYPDIQFRLHANARVEDKLFFFDASSNMGEGRHKEYCQQLKKIINVFQAPIYSYHSGRNQTWRESFDHTLKMQDYLQIPTALEGIYPNKDNYGISTFDDYKKFLTGEVYYALDLSHLNIVWHKSKNSGLKWDEFISVVRDLLIHPSCLEIHLSDNNGADDQHQICLRKAWWMEEIENLVLTPGCVVFSEGDQRKNPIFKNKI